MTVCQFIAGSYYERDGGEALHSPHSSSYRAFTAGWEAFTEGGLVIIVVCTTFKFPHYDRQLTLVRLSLFPLQAIYPTVIMLLAALNRSACDNIASYRGNSQFEDTTALSIVFRGSAVVVPARPLDFPSNCPSAPQRKYDEAASASSFIELDIVDCSERGSSSSVVGP